MPKLSPLLILALASFGACAQEAVYRGQDAQGRPVYSDRTQGVKNAQKIELAPPLVSGGDAPASAAEPTAPSAPQAAPSAPKPDPGARRRAIFDAEQALIEAQRQQAEGEEPEGGERLGTVSGASRLAPAYFQRQERLAKAVQEARAALERAQAQ